MFIYSEKLLVLETTSLTTREEVKIEAANMEEINNSLKFGKYFEKTFTLYL